jgi:hypothetical protein
MISRLTSGRYELIFREQFQALYSSHAQILGFHLTYEGVRHCK